MVECGGIESFNLLNRNSISCVITANTLPDTHTTTTCFVLCFLKTIKKYIVNQSNFCVLMTIDYWGFACKVIEVIILLAQYIQVRMIGFVPIGISTIERTRREFVKYKSLAVIFNSMPRLSTTIMTNYKVFTLTAKIINRKSFTFITKICPNNRCYHTSITSP